MIVFRASFPFISPSTRTPLLLTPLRSQPKVFPVCRRCACWALVPPSCPPSVPLHRVSYFVLSYLILSNFILSYLILYYLILYYIILLYTVLSYTPICGYCGTPKGVPPTPPQGGPPEGSPRYPPQEGGGRPNPGWSGVSPKSPRASDGAWCESCRISSVLVPPRGGGELPPIAFPRPKHARLVRPISPQ